jgi:GTPase KRas
MHSGQGFVIVYDITSLDSFEDAVAIYSYILRIKDTDSAPVVICGNKCDLSSSRVVSTEDGERFAAKCNNAPFFETSAKLNINISESMFALVRSIPRTSTEYKCN